MSQLWKEIVNNFSTQRKDHMNEQKSNEVSFFMKYTSFWAVSSKYVRNKLT